MMSNKLLILELDGWMTRRYDVNVCAHYSGVAPLQLMIVRFIAALVYTCFIVYVCFIYIIRIFVYIEIMISFK